MRYLGILLNKRMTHMAEDNIRHLLNKMKLDFMKWSHLQLSMYGRIQAVKMITTYQYNYVMGMLHTSILQTLESE